MDQDLLFILIIIVTVVINIYKAIKKKEQAKQSPIPAPPVMNTSGNDYQEILREMFDQPRATRGSVEYNESESLETLVPMGGSMESIETYEFKAPVYSKSSLESDIFDVTPSITLPAEDDIHNPKTGKQDQHLSAREIASRFNLRNAVVYRAILERPNV